MDARLIRNALKESVSLDIMLSEIQKEVESRRDLLATVSVEEALFNRYQSVYTRLHTGREYFTKLSELLVEILDLVELGK